MRWRDSILIWQPLIQQQWRYTTKKLIIRQVTNIIGLFGCPWWFRQTQTDCADCAWVVGTKRLRKSTRWQIGQRWFYRTCDWFIWQCESRTTPDEANELMNAVQTTPGLIEQRFDAAYQRDGLLLWWRGCTGYGSCRKTIKSCCKLSWTITNRYAYASKRLQRQSNGV